MSWIRAFALAALTLAHVAGAQNSSRTKRGDTSVVLTQGNGKWGAPHDAVELFRVPGDSRETMFGNAYVLQATSDGGVVVFDTKGEEGMIVRRFDKNGKFVRNLGRQGPGPGEYMRSNASIAVHPSGAVYIRDDDKSVSIFGPDGKLAHTFALAFNNGSTLEIFAATDGSVYVRAPFTREGFASTRQRPFLHYSVDGKRLDSVFVTTRWLPEGAPGYQWWQVLPDGRIVFTRTDKVGFLIVGQSGASPLIGEVPSAGVPYIKEERDELEVANNLSVDKCGGRGGQQRVVVPETKLASHYSRVDIDGRIWIAKSTTAQKVPPKIIASCSSAAGRFKAEATYEEPPVFAVFQTDGTYLGEVRFPLRARVTFVGNTAWALVPDADDVMTLVKYRIY
jgi:hypothetical protein